MKPLDTKKRQQAVHCIAAAARELPDSVVESFAAALVAQGGDELSTERVESLVNAVAGSAHRLHLTLLFRCLAETGVTLSPAAIGWALQGAAVQDAYYREAGRIDLVWTGPATPVLTPRRSDQALIEVIDRSTRELFVATFAAYRVPAIKLSLQRAAERGVLIHLILESNESSGGKIRFDPLRALNLGDTTGMTVYVWPLDQRPVDSVGRTGSLHMKCAVADESLILISSANLTEHAFDLNMELGVIIRNHDLGSQLTAHFKSLIQRGVIRPP